MDNYYATRQNQVLILNEIKEVNTNYQELISYTKSINVCLTTITFLMVLFLILRIIRKALY